MLCLYDNIENLRTENTELKQENEQLKNELKELNNIQNDLIESITVMAEGTSDDIVETQNFINNQKTESFELYDIITELGESIERIENILIGGVNNG